MGSKSNSHQDVWWFICTLCHRAYPAHTELMDHKSTVHNSMGRADTLILSQNFELQPILQIVRCETSVLHKILPLKRKSRRTNRRSGLKEDASKNGQRAINISDSNHGNPLQPFGRSSWSTTCRICSLTFPTLGRLKKHVLYLHAPPLTTTQTSSPELPKGPKQEPPEAQALAHEDDDTSGHISADGDDEAPDVSTTTENEPVWEEEEKPNRKTRSGRLLGVVAWRPQPRIYRQVVKRVPGPPRSALRVNCTLCPEVFRIDRLLRKHENKFHKSTEDRTCGICSKVYKTRKWLRVHIQDAHERPRNRVCSTCGAAFSTLPALRRHEQCHVSRDHTCDVCNFSTYTLMLLKRHKLTHNPPSSKCHVCGMLLKSEKTLLIHQIRKHSDQRPFKCELCGKTFKTRYDVGVHKKIHDQGRPRPFLCESCPATFQTSIGLSIHIKGVHGPGRHKCRVCGQQFPGPTNLIRHEINVHGFHRLKTEHKCDHCDKIFAQKNILDNHLLTHQSGEVEKGFICDTCGKTFRTYPNLAQHNVTHLSYEELKHACDVCGKRFGLPHHVRQHKRKHHQDQDRQTDRTQAQIQIRSD